jgi:predicted  nucleic acid-binding Zn-ribbon protein
MQSGIWPTILATGISVLVTLVVTFIFNKLVALPAAVRRQREAEAQEVTSLRTEVEVLKTERDSLNLRVEELETQMEALPRYRQQSINIQQELRNADNALLHTCEGIQQSINLLNSNLATLGCSIHSLQEGQTVTKTSLEKLEQREKNALRLKIISEYQLFTNPRKNPELAWSEMEHHAFFALVEDYEALGGNDYVHSIVLPAMNELEVVQMTDLARLQQVMSARQQ